MRRTLRVNEGLLGRIGELAGTPQPTNVTHE